MHDLLKTAILASQQASEKILEIYNTDFSGTIQTKSDSIQSPLTLADIASNEIITRMLNSASPDIPILSEEGQLDVPRDAQYCWIVDPLDGTKEFIKKNGEFTVNIALTKDHKPILGVLTVPVWGAVFFASKGNGAFRQDNDKLTRLHVSDKTSELIWVGSKTHPSPEEEKLRNKNSHLIKTVTSVGSSLKGVMIAEGTADVYYRFGLTCEWDVCAMHCIVEEAGGIFRELDGGEMLYNRDNHLNEKGFFVVNRAENIWEP